MKKTIPLLFLLFLFSSCESQVGTAIGSAFSNFFTGNGFNSSSSDELYEKMKTDSQSHAADSTSKEGACANPTDALTVISGKNTSNMSKVKDSLCSCKTWGTCDPKSCSCEILCPKNFEILNRSGTATDDSVDNSLAFTNGDNDFYKKYSDYQGFCWGHAVVTQRFNRLAKFDSTRPKFGANDDIVRQRQLKYYISQLNNNEPVDIPGYKNLHDFSSDPEVKELLEESVKKNWAQNAMSTQGLSIISSGEPQGADHYNKLFDDAEFRLSNNQSPAIVFNDRDNPSDAHTVLVNGHGTTPEGQRYLCIRDNNYNPERSYNCQNKMILGSDGTISYGPWSRKRIGKVELSHSENSNTLEQINNLQTRCRDDKNCDGKVKVVNSI